MKFSKMIISTGLVLAAALMIAEAGYNSNNGYQHQEDADISLEHYASGCTGYGCNQANNYQHENNHNHNHNNDYNNNNNNNNGYNNGASAADNYETKCTGYGCNNGNSNNGYNSNSNNNNHNHNSDAYNSNNHDSNNAYNSNNNNNNAYNNQHAAPACSGYGCNSNTYDNGCKGYGCNKNSNSNFGPYHSYPVRPALYGGHGLYNYRGYSRHPPAPAAHYRPIRAYRSCNGYNCQKSNYGLRPVQALVLAPSAYHNRNHNKGHRQASYSNGAPRYSHKAAHHGARYPAARPYRAQNNNRGAYNKRAPAKAYNPAAGY